MDQADRCPSPCRGGGRNAYVKGSQFNLLELSAAPDNKYIKLGSAYYDRVALDAALDALNFRAARDGLYGYICSSGRSHGKRTEFLSPAVPDAQATPQALSPSPDWFKKSGAHRTKAQQYKLASRPADF